MSVGKVVAISVLVCAVLLTLTVGGCTVSCLNREMALRNAVVRKSRSNEASLDAMWKIISQKAKISQVSVGDITKMNEVYKDLVSGRSGGTLFKMVTESYPNLGAEKVAAIYQDLMRSVEAERKTFKSDQLVLQDLLREHDNSQTMVTASWALYLFGGPNAARKFKPKGDADTPENWPADWQYVWVTSSSTKHMVQSGEENDLNLFSTKAERE